MSAPPFSLIGPDVTLGKNVKILGWANLYGCSIGDDCKIGPFVEIQKGVRIGRRVKISSHSFLCEGVTVEDDCFIGHGVLFINDKYPVASRGGVPTNDSDWTPVPSVIGAGASIGSGAVILCGVIVGAGALIGAGAVVTKNVTAGSVVAGVPARALLTGKARR